MPSLIVSSRYTTDSQVLRETAQKLGWETLRLDGQVVPEWFEPPDDRIALFYTAPHAFEIADQFSRTLLGCNPDWTIQLPHHFLHRRLGQMTLAEALSLPGHNFVKHAISKAFPAVVYDADALAVVTSNIHPSSLTHVAEPVEWSAEYRCFILDREVATTSLYRRQGEDIRGHTGLLDTSAAEIDSAERFAESVVKSVDCPPAFVLDVGVIPGRGWAVVEFNECWASGIYACDPVRVLDTLVRACFPTAELSPDGRRWDFREHYFAASR